MDLAKKMDAESFADKFSKIANSLSDKREETVKKVVSVYWVVLKDFPYEILYKVLLESTLIDDRLPKPHVYANRCWALKEQYSQAHPSDPDYGRRPQDLRAMKEFYVKDSKLCAEKASMNQDNVSNLAHCTLMHFDEERRLAERWKRKHTVNG